ncbi:MAG: glycosyltransferase [Phycisphaeraceae bacterium]
MMPAAPRVTVLLPVYNAQRYLAAALGSILAQDFADFEVLAINDGSTDASPAILREIAAGDRRIRVIQQANAGLVATLNRGLELARGALVARMDGDDVAMPDRLRRQVAYLEEHPECLAVGGRILLIDADGLPLCQMCQQMSHEDIDAFNMQAGGSAINHPSATYRAQAVRQIGGYRAASYPAEDLDLWLRLAEVGRLANLPQVVTQYRVHDQSISHASSQKQKAAWRAAVLQAHQRRGHADARLPAAPDTRIAGFGHSVADQHIRWAWMALMSGHVHSARKHALAGMWRRPYSLETWKLAYCAMRGR